MQRSSVRRRVPVPSVTTQKSQTKDYQFTRGIDSNSSNDNVGPEHWRYATDTREVQVGKWETRKGNELLSISDWRDGQCIADRHDRRGQHGI
jgi:hypothetical protein